MSHEEVAGVWAALYCRSDIDNIIQEATGRFYLVSSEYTPDRELFRGTAFHHIVELRTIFDLQRTYLQSPQLSFESKISLLSPDVLLSTIRHLLDVKILAFAVHDGLADYDAQLSYLGQTLVSGVRALHLMRRPLSSTEHKSIMCKFKKAWDNETLPGVDHFSINLFCHRMLAELRQAQDNQDTRLYSPACGLLESKDFFSGLYPLDGSGNAFVRAAEAAISTSKSSVDWFYCALVLYDVSWSTTAAMIQLCMDNRNVQSTNNHNYHRDAALKTVSPRLKLLDQLFKDSITSPPPGELEWAYEQTLSMLCLSIKPACFGQNCPCLGMYAVQELWYRHMSETAVGSMNRHLGKLSHVDVRKNLESFRINLQDRHNLLPDIGKEFLAVSRAITKYTEEWCPGLPKNRTSDGRRSIVPDDMFIVSCPELHAVPGKIFIPTLEKHSADKVQKNGLDLIKDVRSNRSCGQCSPEPHSVTVRKIEPLSRLSAYVQDRLKQRRKLLQSRTDAIITLPPAPPLQRSGKATSPRRHELPATPPQNRSERRLPSEDMDVIQPLQAIRGNSFPLGKLEYTLRSKHNSMDMRGFDTRTLLKPASPATTYLGSVSSPSTHSASLSRPASRTFSPPVLPTPEQTTSLPEVVVPRITKVSSQTSPQSIRSDTSSTRGSGSRWSFISRRGLKGTSNIPSAAFYTSGRALLLWNDRGACFYDLQNKLAIQHHAIATGDIVLAAGGTHKCAVVSINGPMIMLRIFQGAKHVPVHELELEQTPFAIAVSSNDHYVGLKFGNYARILDTLTGAFFHHILPPLDGRNGLKDHLITFSTDCLSFAAATRFEPEQVITYFCDCQNPSGGDSVESSAPYFSVGDDGLSSIVYSDKSAFITTFTEKGYPAYLSLLPGRASSRVLRDKNQQIGSRIHRAVICATGQNLVLLNDRNELYWIETPFGKERLPDRIGNVKREKSVKRDVELGMPNDHEVHIFWIYKGKGIFATRGRAGGKSTPIELDVDMNHLLESE